MTRYSVVSSQPWPEWGQPKMPASQKAIYPNTANAHTAAPLWRAKSKAILNHNIFKPMLFLKNGHFRFFFFNFSVFFYSSSCSMLKFSCTLLLKCIYIIQSPDTAASDDSSSSQQHTKNTNSMNIWWKWRPNAFVMHLKNEKQQKKYSLQCACPIATVFGSVYIRDKSFI